MAHDAGAEFIEKLREFAHNTGYAGHHAIVGLEKGEFSRENLIQWAYQKGYQITHHIRAFGGVYLHAPGLDVREYIVGQLIDEETDISCGDEPHHDLFYRFAEALGCDRQIMETLEPIPEVGSYLDWLLEIARTEPAVVTLAALCVVGENQSPEPVRRIHDALRDQYGVAPKDLEFFAVHIEGDQAHSADAEKLVARYADTDELRERCFEVAKEYVARWDAMQDGYLAVLRGAHASQGDLASAT